MTIILLLINMLLTGFCAMCGVGLIVIFAMLLSGNPRDRAMLEQASSDLLFKLRTAVPA
jgi:hypothetical protein